MKKTLILLAILSLPVCTRAQNTYIPDTTADQFFKMQQLNGERYMDAGHKNEGMYLFEEWFPGKVLLRSGEWVFNVPLRYNGYTDDLLWLKGSTVQIRLDKESLLGFTITVNHRDYQSAR